MDPDDFPENIRGFLRWLEGTGFTVTEERGEGMVNRRVVLGNEELSVEIVADRGEWSIALAFSPDRWMHPDVWESYLEGFPLAGDPSSLDHQIEFVQRNLSRIAATASPQVEDELARIGEEYMRRRLGIGPDH
jgi:hypothetical protein